MKVLFDPIYSTALRKCSSALKFKTLALAILAADPNNFVHWHVPDWMDQDDHEWLPAHPRVIYHPLPYARVYRNYEYVRLNDKVIDHAWAHGELWDWDVLVTMRTQHVSAFRVLCSAARFDVHLPHKTIVVLEEMLMVSSRDMGQPDVPAQDRSVVGGILDSDVTFVTVQHVKDHAIAAARNVATPTDARSLNDKIKIVRPIEMPPLRDKRGNGYMPKPGQKPVLLFSGRTNGHSSRMDEIFKVMTTDYALGGDAPREVRFSSVSDSIKNEVPSHIVREKNDRAAFHKMLEQEVHVGIYMARDADFSLTTLEPICFGVPMIVADEKWSRGLLGPHYPLFAKNVAQAKGLLDAITDDYETWYANFMTWRAIHFVPRFSVGGLYGDSLTYSFLKLLSNLNAKLNAATLTPKDMAYAMAQVAKPGETVNLFDLMLRAADAKLIKADVKGQKERWSDKNTGSTFKYDMQAIRHRLIHQVGARDTDSAGFITFPEDMTKPC